MVARERSGSAAPGGLWVVGRGPVAMPSSSGGSVGLLRAPTEVCEWNVRSRWKIEAKTAAETRHAAPRDSAPRTTEEATVGLERGDNRLPNRASGRREMSVSMSQDNTVQLNSVCLRGCEENGDGCNACVSAVCPWCLSTRASPEQDAREAQHYESDVARHWRRASAVPPPCMGRRPFLPIPIHGWHGLAWMGWMGWSFHARQCPPLPASRLHEDRIRGVCYLLIRPTLAVHMLPPLPLEGAWLQGFCPPP